jgi:predicted nucleotidyltransferase
MPNYNEKTNLGPLTNSEFFDLDNAPFNIEGHCLYSVLSGSRAYGIETPTSDYDYRGVLWLDEKYLLGLSKCEQVESSTKDITYYSLNKLFQLSLKNNVHAMEILWMPERSVQMIHPLFQQVLDNKEIFLSKRVGYTCGHYAFQQVKIALTKLKNKTGRVELIEKYGYDTKFMSHAIRIYRMAREVLETGHLEVYRNDREFLLDVKLGKYKLEDLVVMDKDENDKDIFTGGLLYEEQKKFYEALNNTTLPEDPPFEKIEKLLIKVQKETLGI